MQDLCLKEVIEDITIHREKHPSELKSSMKVPVC